MLVKELEVIKSINANKVPKFSTIDGGTVHRVQNIEWPSKFVADVEEYLKEHPGAKHVYPLDVHLID